jgi:hypothetical protein
MWRSSSMGLPFLVRVTGSMSLGGGSSIVGGRSGWGGEVDCRWLRGSPDGGLDGVGDGVGDESGGGVSVGCGVGFSFSASCSSGFPSSPFGCCGLVPSNGRGSMAFPARLGKAACLPAEGVVNGAACWDDGGRAEGLRQALRTAWDAAGSVQRLPARKRCG